MGLNWLSGTKKTTRMTDFSRDLNFEDLHAKNKNELGLW
jgi:hypothetical protein